MNIGQWNMASSSSDLHHWVLHTLLLMAAPTAATLSCNAVHTVVEQHAFLILYGDFVNAGYPAWVVQWGNLLEWSANSNVNYGSV